MGGIGGGVVVNSPTGIMGTLLFTTYCLFLFDFRRIHSVYESPRDRPELAMQAADAEGPHCCRKSEQQRDKEKYGGIVHSDSSGRAYASLGPILGFGA